MRLLTIIIGLFFSLFFTSCSVKKSVENLDAQFKEETIVPESKFANNIAVSRALVAKMLAMIHNDLNSINSEDILIDFKDLSPSTWYYKYINKAYMDNLMLGTEGEFKPLDNVTIGQAQILLDNLDVNNKIKIDIDDNNKDKLISYGLWMDMYKKMLLSLSDGKGLNDAFGISEKSIVVLETTGNNSQLKEYNMITDLGLVTHYGLNMDSYVNKEIMVLEKNNDIIGVVEMLDFTPTIEGVYIVGSTEKDITIFAGGVEKTYEYPNKYENIEGKIANISINENKLVEIFIYEDRISDVIKRVTNNDVEFENIKNYPIVNNIKVYKTYDGNVKLGNLNSIIVGLEGVDFVLKDGLVYSAVVKEKPNVNNLRVAISTTNYESLIHKDVTVSGTGDIKISNVDNVITYLKGEEVLITEDLFEKNRRIYIEPIDEDSKIKINSIKRNWPDNESPEYRGIIEIAMEEEEVGYTIVNEINIEDYLYAVVPSEIPSSYGVEASMVQSITARSFAYNEFIGNRFRKYGANIVDSVSSQVYNNIPENDVSITAVNNTKGEYLKYDGRVVTANFFSTSAGITANQGEVWADTATKQFPTYTSRYLVSKVQFEGEDFGDLSKEDNMKKFITDTNIPSYDSTSDWFRWETKMKIDEISESINRNLKNRYEANKQLIKVKQSNGRFISEPVERIGEVKDITVNKRSTAGNLMELIIEGTETTILVKTEYNIRALIKPYQYIEGRDDIILNRHDGSIVENYSIMPSAFYVIEKELDEDDNIESITFYGGGNGHGVGMSQNAVKGMLDLGYNIEYILKHFYEDTVVEPLD